MEFPAEQAHADQAEHDEVEELEGDHVEGRDDGADERVDDLLHGGTSLQNADGRRARKRRACLVSEG